MRAIYNFLQNISEITGKIIAWFTLILVIVTIAAVLIRYGSSFCSHISTFFLCQWIASLGQYVTPLQEAEYYLHGFIFLLGAAYTLKHQGHVRVDIFYRFFPNKAQAIINLLGTIFFLLPIASILLWYGSQFAYQSWSLPTGPEGSPEPGGLPLLFLLKTSIPVAGLLLTLQAIAQILENILILFNQLKSPKEEINLEI